MMYFAFVQNQLLYGIEIYGNATRSNFNKLLILNTKILRIIKKPKHCNVQHRYNDYNILPIQELHKF